MIPINYHHLYYFWIVARSGSIAAATQRLCLSQPALSTQLKSLEKACGAKLLERSRKGITLTFEGRAVLEHCERIFSEGEDLVSLVRNGFKSPALLHLGVRPTISREVLLHAIDFAVETESTCNVTIISGEPDVMISRLKTGAVDLVISNRDYSSYLGKGFRSRMVSRLPVYFVANPDIKRKVTRFPTDLNKTTLLLKPDYNPVRKQVDLFLARKRVTCTVAADTDDVDLLRRLALEGRGVAVLSGPSVADDLKSGRLVALHGTEVGLEELVWFACSESPCSNPAVRNVLDALMDRFKFPWKTPASKIVN